MKTRKTRKPHLYWPDGRLGARGPGSARLLPPPVAAEVADPALRDADPAGGLRLQRPPDEDLPGEHDRPGPGTATDAGIFGASDTRGTVEHGEDRRARRHERRGGRGGAAHGRAAEGSLRGAISADGRRGHRLHHDHRHRRQRRARRGDRETRRTGAAGHARAQGVKRSTRRWRRREGAREAPPGEELQRRSCPSSSRAARPARGAEREHPGGGAGARSRRSVSPNPKRNAILAFVVALLIAAGAVALAERLDRRLHDSRDLERLTGTPLLAQVPASAFPARRRIRSCRSSSRRSGTASPTSTWTSGLSSLLVISPLKGDGKTSVATNLAVASRGRASR